MKSELADECNYSREASFLRLFRSHLENDTRFHVSVNPVSFSDEEILIFV